MRLSRCVRIAARALPCMLLVICCAGGVNAQQQPASPTPPLVTTPNASPTRLILIRSLLTGVPRRTIAVQEEAQTVTYSGVDLGALLAKNGAPQGAALRGPAVAQYALVRAADGYRATFALCELDSSVTAKVVLVADIRNGAPLSADLGPFRIVVPDEKHHLRWIRNAIEIDVLTPP